MVGHSHIIRKCTIAKQSGDLHTANLNQAIIDIILRENFLRSHIEKICKDYQVQMEAMLGQMAGLPKGTVVTKPQGGLFVFVTLPEKINATALLDIAVKEKVAYVPGTFFYPEGGNHHALRLNFSATTTDQIIEGMAKLKDLFNRELL